VDMRSPLLSLEATERVCGQERSDKSVASCDEKPSHSNKKRYVATWYWKSPRVPRKARTEKHRDLCKKHGGAYTTHNARHCQRFEKDGTEKSDFRAAKKGGKKPNPVEQSFTQLSKRSD